jgi:hypothetical protein
MRPFGRMAMKWILFPLLMLGLSPGPSIPHATEPDGKQAEGSRDTAKTKPAAAGEESRTVPAVELNYGGPVGEWKGRRLSQIIQPKEVSRIIRLHERSLGDTFRMGVGDGDSQTRDRKLQTGYNAFLDGLFKSDQKATDASLGDNEGIMAEVIIVMKDGRVFQVEILETGGTPASAVLVSGPGNCARIPVGKLQAPSSNAK